MSLYSLANDLFADIDKARATRAPAADRLKKQGRQPYPRRRDLGIAVRNGGELLPRLTSARHDDAGQPPTIELLEGCLRELQQIRSGVRLEPVFGPDKNNEERDAKIPFGDFDGQGSSSSVLPPSSEAAPSSSDTLHNENTTSQRGLIRASGENLKIFDAFAATTMPAEKSDDDRAARTTRFSVRRTLEVNSLQCFSSALRDRRSERALTVDDDGSRVGGGRCSASMNEAEANRISKPFRRQKITPFRLLAEGGKILATDQAVGTPDAVDIDIDATATASFVDFEHEVGRWEAIAEMDEKESPHLRIEFAEHLSAKYLCGVLDPMPSSPVVCRLRREVARRIDLLAAVAGTGVVAPATTADAVSKEGERGLATRGDSSMRGACAFCRCGHVGVMGSGGSYDHKKKNDALLNRSKSHGTCDVSPIEQDGRRTRGRFSFAGIQASSKRRLSSTRCGEVACRASSRTILPSRVAGEVSPSLPHATIESKKEDSERTSSRSSDSSSGSSSDSSSGSTSGSESSHNHLPHWGNEGPPPFRNERAAMMRREVGPVFRKATQYSLDKVRKNTDRGVGHPNASFRPPKGGRREGKVRFDLEDKKATTEEADVGSNASFLQANETVHDEFQTVQKNAGRGESKATCARAIGKFETEAVEPTGLWTCVTCSEINDEIAAAEGCAHCGRWRQRHWQTRPDKIGGTEIQTVPLGNMVTGGGETSPQAQLDRPKEESEEIVGDFRNAIKSSGDVTTSSTELSGKAKLDRGRCGSYDMSSFAKMRQVTQPVLKARLGLTREIQSLLSAIRR